MRDDVRFQLGNCRDWQPRHTPSLVVVNPPWGNRLLPDEGDGAAMNQPGDVAAISPELQQAWVDLRDFLKVRHCSDQRISADVRTYSEAICMWMSASILPQVGTGCLASA